MYTQKMRNIGNYSKIIAKDILHRPHLPYIIPHISPVTMFAKLHVSLTVNLYRFCNTTDRAFPHIRRHPAVSGNIHGPGLWDRCSLLCLYRLVVTRATNPPGFLFVLNRVRCSTLNFSIYKEPFFP